jgi:hypothetical protein
MADIERLAKKKEFNNMIGLPKRHYRDCEYRIPIHEDGSNVFLCKIMSEESGHTVGTTMQVCARCQSKTGKADRGYLNPKIKGLLRNRLADVYYGFYESEDAKKMLILAYKHFKDEKQTRLQLRNVIEQVIKLRLLEYNEVEELIKEKMPELLDDELSEEIERDFRGPNPNPLSSISPGSI